VTGPDFSDAIDDPRDEALRGDIRRLGAELGATLIRQQGAGLLDLVERVRALTKSVRLTGDADAGVELEEVLGDLPLDDVINLVRAFSAYFYLANVAEQTHRVGDLPLTDDDRTIAATVDRILEAELDHELVSTVIGRLELRPVFTAHPTEAARRTLLTKLRHIAELLADRAGP